MKFLLSTALSLTMALSANSVVVGLSRSASVGIAPSISTSRAKPRTGPGIRRPKPRTGINQQGQVLREQHLCEGVICLAFRFFSYL